MEKLSVGVVPVPPLAYPAPAAAGAAAVADDDDDAMVVATL